MFELLGFTAEQAQERFGFLMNAFKYGAPPHGGLAFGFDRLCSLFGGSESIRDYIAFPKNNNGRDMMLDAPGYIDQAQLDELRIQLVKPEELGKTRSRMASVRSLQRLLRFCMILLACSLAMLITVYTCGTAATGDKVRAWVTVLLLLALMGNSYRSMRRKERERHDKLRK